jgi:hypothetical protein
MSERKEQAGKKSLPNPAVRYYDFKGKSDAFKYYDKEAQTEKSVMPLSVALITIRNEVSGYHKRTKSGIWSTSISEYGVGKEPLKVFSQKPDKNNNTALGNGIWKEIKEQVKGQGGHFTRVLYAYEFGVGIVKVNLTGTAMEAFGDFVKGLKNKEEQYDCFIEVKSTTKKDEEDDYSIPVFTIGKKLTEKQEKDVDLAYTQMKEYFASKSESAPESAVGNEYDTDDVLEGTVTITDGDDLPF